VACSDAESLAAWSETLGATCLVQSKSDPIERAELLQVDVGLCTAQIGISETGTLVLCSETEMHRLVSLVPPASVIVLYAQDLVPDMASTLRTLESHRLPTTTSFITGPSRTADIELTLAVGVHGPRSLDVILIERDL
jgi:L-lactate dehydrogenase complex protein LldG